MARRAWSYYTVEEYLEAEEATSDKHEYYRGEIYLMAGGSPRHSAIGGNVIFELGAAFRKKHKGCLVYTSDIKIHVPAETYFTYPDAAIICGEPKLHPLSRTTVENPLLIAEVLSPSTADHDRTTKFNLYSRLETLEHYLLIDQERVGVEYRWLDENGLWQSEYYESRDDVIQLQGYDLQLSVAEFYYGIDL